MLLRFYSTILYNYRILEIQRVYVRGFKCEFVKMMLSAQDHTNLCVSSSWLCLSSSNAWRRPRKSVMPYMRAYFSYSLGSTFLRSSMISISSSSPEPLFKVGALSKIRNKHKSPVFYLFWMVYHHSKIINAITKFFFSQRNNSVSFILEILISC